MNVVLKYFILSLAFAAPTTVQSQCNFCPDGIENAGAQISGGLLKCEDAELFLGYTEGIECQIHTFSVTQACCPSYIPHLGSKNPCGFCRNGMVNPDALVTVPGGTDTRTCFDVMTDVAVGFYLSDGVGSCASATPQATEVCCPGDTTADPAPTDPPAGTDPVCEFCPLGIEITGDVLLPLNIAGIGGSTCEELSAGAPFITNYTECLESIKPLEGLCCPETTTNYRCDWCSGDLGIENPDLLVPEADITCEAIGTLVKTADSEEMCLQFKEAESLCCPSTLGAIPCDFCRGPLGVEFPDEVVDEDEPMPTTCGDLAYFVVVPPTPDYCDMAIAAQGLCCPASTVSLPQGDTTESGMESAASSGTGRILVALVSLLVVSVF